MKQTLTSERLTGWPGTVGGLWPAAGRMSVYQLVRTKPTSSHMSAEADSSSVEPQDSCSWATGIRLVGGSWDMQGQMGFQFSSVTQSCPTLATPWTAARKAFPSITNSRNLPKHMSVESVMPSKHLILCRPLLLLPSVFPRIRVFSNEVAKVLEFGVASGGQSIGVASGGQSTGVSASASVLPMNIQD